MSKSTLPSLPALPALGKPGTLPKLPALVKPAPVVLRTLAEQAALDANPLDVNEPLYTGNTEHDTSLDTTTMMDAFSSIRNARAEQAAAVALANETEYWFCVYFQSTAQKDAYLAAMMAPLGIDSDKYIDGVALAAAQGVALPKRPAPYKVGRLDKKLSDLA